MRTIKQINIKNRQNYFFNDITNVGDFDLSLLNIEQIAFKSNDSIIDDIKYIKNLNGSNYLYLVFNNLDEYIEKSGEKNEMVLRDYTEIWDEIKEKVKLIN